MSQDTSFGPLRALIPAEKLILDIYMFGRALLTAAPPGILKSVLRDAFFRGELEHMRSAGGVGYDNLRILTGCAVLHPATCEHHARGRCDRD
jgi:hypothetical protein